MVNKFSGELSHLSLVNQAQFLMVNKSSVEWLLNLIPANALSDSTQDLIQRFRPNFVVDLKTPFVEKELCKIKIGDSIFEVNIIIQLITKIKQFFYFCQTCGQCTRCQMICIDQNTGEKSVEPLRTLSKECGGKITFGTYLRCSNLGTDAIVKTSLIFRI